MKATEMFTQLGMEKKIVQIHSQNELLPVMRGSEVLISVTTES
jgi:hypothetical protein